MEKSDEQRKKKKKRGWLTGLKQTQVTPATTHTYISAQDRDGSTRVGDALRYIRIDGIDSDQRGGGAEVDVRVLCRHHTAHIQSSFPVPHSPMCPPSLLEWDPVWQSSSLLSCGHDYGSPFSASQRISSSLPSVRCCITESLYLWWQNPPFDFPFVVLLSFPPAALRLSVWVRSCTNHHPRSLFLVCTDDMSDRQQQHQLPPTISYYHRRRNR